MSRIWGIIVGVCAVIGVGAIVFHFAGARGDVAKKKVLNKIDQWLGESDVQRAEIERGIKGMEDAVDTLSTAKIKAQIEAEKLAKELKANEKKVAESKAALTKLRDDLKKFDTETSYTVSYGSKTYTKKDDLSKFADKVIEAHKSLIDQTEKQKQRLETYETTAKTLAARHDDATKKLAEYKTKLKDLDSKIEMVKAQREAAAALNETDKTFADSVKGIEDKINKLDASTETAARKEAEKWKELSANTEVEDATKIISDTKDKADEIDKLLGNK